MPVRNVLVTVVCCLSIFARADPCSLQAGVYPEATGKACLESLKLKPNETEKVLAQYQMTLDLNTLVPYYNDPATAAKYKFDLFDIYAELQVIRNRTYGAAYELYRDLAFLALKMRDPHSRFVASPCFSSVGFQALFGLEWLNKSDRVTIKLTFPQAALLYLMGELGGDASESKRQALLDAAISSTDVVVDSLRLEGATNFSGRPADVIQQVADTVTHSARSRATRIDFAMLFFFKYPSAYGIAPTHRVFATLAGTEYELPWFTFVNKDIVDGDSMMEPCLAKSAKTVRRDFELSLDHMYRRTLPWYHPLHLNSEPQQYQALETDSSDEGDFELISSAYFVTHRKYRPKDRPDMSATYIGISSFHTKTTAELESMWAEWRKVLYNICEAPKRDKYLVIDLTGNGGGVCRSSLLFYHDLFGGEMARPAGGNWKMTRTVYRESLAQKYDLKKLGLDLETFHFATTEYPVVVNKHTTHEKVGDMTCTTLFNITFAPLEITDPDSGLPEELFPFLLSDGKLYRPRLHWQAHEIFVLTDMMTGSAATMFAQKVRQFHVARTVYVGGRFLSPTEPDPNVPASTGTCGGTTVLLSSAIVNNSKKAYNLDLPGAFRGEEFGFAAYHYVSYLDHRDLWEFMQFAPDFQIPFWFGLQHTVEDTKECLDLLFDRIKAVGSEPDKYSWKKAECDVDSAFSGGDRNLIVGGHFYDPAKKAFDESVCRPVYCTENAYPTHYDKDGFLWGCTKLIDESEASSLASVGALLCVLATLLVWG